MKRDRKEGEWERRGGGGVWTECGGKARRGGRGKDRSKIAEKRWRSRGHTAERNGRKKPHFHGGLSAGDVPYRHIARWSICSGQSVPFFAPTYTHGHSPFRHLLHIGVTTAFYKVRDSSAKMCIRASLPCPIPFFHPPSFYPVSLHPFSLELLSSYSVLAYPGARLQCVSISIRRRTSRSRTIFVKFRLAPFLIVRITWNILNNH